MQPKYPFAHFKLHVRFVDLVNVPVEHFLFICFLVLWFKHCKSEQNVIAIKSSPLERYTNAFSLWAGTRSEPGPAFRDRGWVSVYSLRDWFDLRPAGEANICVRSWDRKLLRGPPEQRASVTQLRDSEVWTGAVCQQPSAVNSVPWCQGDEGGGIPRPRCNKIRP